MSFFDEDDEPRTRVRSRRPATARASAAPPDRRTALLRQGALFGGLAVIAVVLVVLISSCQNSAKQKALKQYNQDVGAIVADSDSQVGKPLFDLMRNPTQGDLSAQINGYKVQAEQQYKQAKRIDTPDEMVAAQRSFLIAMELRRDGLQSIADQVRTALGSNEEAATKAIDRIAGAMAQFLSSDVIYEARVAPFIEDELRDADVSGQRPQHTQFLRGYQWIQPDVVADALGQQVTGGTGGREPAPGLHGSGIDSVQVGDQTLQPDTPNRIAYGPDTEFTVNFTNQGENDEVDVTVVLVIEGGPKPIRVQKKVPTVAAGAKASATLVPKQPPLDTPVEVRVEVKPVPGEKKKDNNKAEFRALFSKQ